MRECSACTQSAQETTASERRLVTKFFTTSTLSELQSRGRLCKEEGPKPSRKRVTPEGWAVDVPYSATTARTKLRNGAVPQRLFAAPSSRPRSHVATHCSCSHAGSPAPPWVTGSPVAFLVATRR